MVVNVRISRTIKSVAYFSNSGQSTIGLQSTALIPRAEGKAQVQHKQGVTYIEGEVSKLVPATFGSLFLPYVLRAITPEGSTSNLGEGIVNGTSDKIEASTKLHVLLLRLRFDRQLVVDRSYDHGKRRSRIVRHLWKQSPGLVAAEHRILVARAEDHQMGMPMADSRCEMLIRRPHRCKTDPSPLR